MMMKPITHGQADESGRPANGSNTSTTTPAPIARSEVVETVSKPPVMAVFQPAWQAAANSTAVKTRESITLVLPPLVRLEDVMQHEMHEFGRDHKYEQQKDPSARLR